MSREILFRGKRIDNGEWVEGYFVKGEWYFDKKEIYALLPLDLCFFPRCEISEWVEVDPKTICQYTGLTDKNGRKIFEGDIITYQHDNDDCPFPNKDTKRRVGRVYFQEFRSCFAVAEGRNGSDRINQDLFKYVQNGNRVEVIGNIFDNPELLKGA